MSIIRLCINKFCACGAPITDGWFSCNDCAANPNRRKR